MLNKPSLYATKSIEEIASVKSNSTLNGPQVIFQQVCTIARLPFRNCH